jgi:putative PIG3 family NAD(P)H quinone oxidoreductase
MRAVTISEPGGPEKLQWTEVPDPQPGPGEVLIDIAASAVNRADVLQRRGFYPPPPGAPEYPGLECSGRIAELGEGVEGWSVGDEVCALLAGGGYAERVAVPAAQLLPVPAGVDLEEAAGLPEVACTVWSNVVMVGRLQADELLLVHGGAGGIGTHAIQVGKALGARVAVTAGTQERVDKCRELGADIAINYREEDFVEIVKAEGGADVILDVMGAKYLDRNIDALAFDGRLVIIGMQGGTKGELNIGKLLSKRCSVAATNLRARPVDNKATIIAAVREHLWPLIEQGAVRPIIGRRVPMSNAAEAHRALEDSQVFGKLLLTVG